MIYSQSTLMYLLTVVTSLGLTRRLVQYLETYFNPQFAVLVSATILLHPLSIDALMAPNLLNGVVAFWLFLESLFLMKEGHEKSSFGLMILASICNISYSLFPVYYFIRNRSKTSLVLISALTYIVLIILYYIKLWYPTFHNPIVFASYFVQNLVAPIYLTNFTPAMFSFSIFSMVSAVLILLLIFWGEDKNKLSRPFWPMLILPLIGSVVHQWTEPVNFWSEFIFNGSTFLCMTFAFVTMVAIHIPKKAFVVYFCLMSFFSFNWAAQWMPHSRAFRESVLNLPQEYPKLLEAKRVLVWELIYEGKLIEGKMMAEELLKNNQGNKDLENDLFIIRNQR